MGQGHVRDRRERALTGETRWGIHAEICEVPRSFQLPFLCTDTSDCLSSVQTTYRDCLPPQPGSTLEMGRPISALGLLLALLPFSMATGGNPLIVQAQNQHCGSAPCPHRGALATSLTVSLHGSGAHRRLEYRLAVRCPEAEGAAAGEGATRATAAAECAAAVALLQSLPPVIYADIYELDNEAAAGRGPAVNLFGTVDVESIERYAEAMVLAVYASGGNGSAADQQQVGRVWDSDSMPGCSAAAAAWCVTPTVSSSPTTNEPTNALLFHPNCPCRLALRAARQCSRFRCTHGTPTHATRSSSSRSQGKAG